MCLIIPYVFTNKYPNLNVVHTTAKLGRNEKKKLENINKIALAARQVLDVKINNRNI